METISYVLRQNAGKVGYYRVVRVDKKDTQTHTPNNNKKYHELMVYMESKDHPIEYMIDEDWESVYEEVKHFVEKSIKFGMYGKATIYSDVYGARKFGDHNINIPDSPDDIEYTHSSDENENENEMDSDDFDDNDDYLLL
jgi:hypothetical protein